MATRVYTAFSKDDWVWVHGLNTHPVEAAPAKARAGPAAAAAANKPVFKPPEPPKVAAQFERCSPDGNECVVRLVWGDLCPGCEKPGSEHCFKPATLTLTQNDEYSLQKMSQSNREGRQNMMDLDDLQVGELMFNLRNRYKANPMQYYTYVGEILIVSNPLENKGLIGMHKMVEYYDQPFCDPSLPPHIYAVGDEVLRRLMRTNKNQSIVISGESGAGKSESTKHVLEYITYAAQRKNGSHPPPPGQEGHDINASILATSEVLEAFGNAKTTRNDNSSRFGKFVEIHMDREFKVIGANINQYLLEKSRIVLQEERERNYHIFYMLFKALSPAEKAVLHLGDVNEYVYLTGVGGANRATMFQNVRGEQLDDVERFHTFVSCMDKLGMGEAFRHEVFELVAAVLLFGQLRFEVGPGGENVDIIISNDNVVVWIAELLKMDVEKLRKSLKGYKVATTTKIFSPEQARDNADAFAKHIYGKFFEYLVQVKINEAIGEQPPHHTHAWLGVLDIFGFESFESKDAKGLIISKNRFEQLCINLTNEMLQKFFYENQIPKQLEMYRAENLDVANIQYADNTEAVNLIMAPKESILAFLDETTKKVLKQLIEEKKNPDGVLKSDADFFGQLRAFKFGTDPAANEELFRTEFRTQRNHFFTWWKDMDKGHAPARDKIYFGVYHYAGKVWYTAVGAVEKNKDALKADCNIALQSSANPMIQNMAVPEDGGGGKVSNTVAGKFTASLTALKAKLEETDPMFVRCVKPNCIMKKGGFFEDWKVLEQLISAGMGAIVEMRMAGYPVQRSKQDFIDEFKVLEDDQALLKSKSIDDQIRYLAQMVVDRNPAAVKNITNMPPFQVGVSKAFLKDNMYKEMSKARDEALRLIKAKKRAALLHVQSLYRMYKERRTLPERVERYETVKRRLERIRQLVAQGHTKAEAEAIFEREEEAERQRIKEVYRVKHVEPFEIGSRAAVEPLPALVAEIDRFVGIALKPSERDAAKARKAEVAAAVAAMDQAMAALRKDFYNKERTEELKAAAAAAVDKATALVRAEVKANQADFANHAAQLTRLEEMRIAEIERRKQEAREKLLAEKKELAEREQRELQAKLDKMQFDRERKKREKMAKREAVTEARRAKREEELAERKRRLELEEQERRAKDKELRRMERRKLRENTKKEAQSLALKGTVVKFSNMLCTVAYVGELPYEGSGTFIGIITPKPMGAKLGTSGALMGTSFFECPPEQGMFVRPHMLHVVKTSPHVFVEGDTVWRKRSKKLGVVRWTGELHAATGQWVGVELLEGKGKNDGSVAGVRYFAAKPYTAIFCRPEDLAYVIPWTAEFAAAVTQEYCIINDLDTDGQDDDADAAIEEELELQESLTAIKANKTVITVDESEIMIADVSTDEFLGHL